MIFLLIYLQAKLIIEGSAHRLRMRTRYFTIRQVSRFLLYRNLCILLKRFYRVI